MHRRTVPVKWSSNKFGAALALHYLCSVINQFGYRRENRRRQCHTFFKRSTRTLCPGGIPPRENHRNGRCPGCRRPDRPYPHPVRCRPARRIVRQTDRNGDHRLRPHRHGILSATRHRSSDRRRMQCTGRTAIRRRSTGPPLTSTGLGTYGQNPRNRRCRTRRVARRGLRPDVGIPRRGMRSPPAKSASTADSCRSKRWRARPTSSPSTLRWTIRPGTWPGRSSSSE